MKKILLLLWTVLAVSSCDKSDDSLPQIPYEPYVRYLKVQINGVEFIYDDITVQKEDVPNAGNPYTDLIITAKRTNDTSSKINFRLEYMQPGTESCYYFVYSPSDVEYDIEDNNSFEITVTTSNGTKIIGNFQGLLYDIDNNPISLSNGNFEISL